MDPLVEEEIKVVIEEIYNNRNNYRLNYRNRSRGRWNSHRSGDRSGNYPNYNRHIIRDQTTDKTPNGLLEIEVKVGIEMRIMIMIIPEAGVDIEIIGEEKSLGPNLTLG